MTNEIDTYQPAWTAIIRKVDEATGITYEEEVENIDADGKFTMDQRYLIPVNSKEDDSTTYLRCTIPEGTHYKEGYKQMQELLQEVCDTDAIYDLARTLEIEEILS